MASDLEFRIHPSIGIARVGDSDEFFIGPELPGQKPEEPRKMAKKIRRQAARFRVFAFRRDAGTLKLVGEVRLGVNKVKAIRWTVELANKKASFFGFDGLKGEHGAEHDGADIPPLPRRNAGPGWDILPGAKTISGKNAAAVRFDEAGGGAWPKNAAGQAVITYLGELRTDDEGRLLVLGGHGRSASTKSPPAALPQYANNAAWLDDVSDGPVTAEITFDDGSTASVGEAGAAWCMVAPPDFAPEIAPVVSLYDLLVDMTARKLTVPTDEAVFIAGGELAWLADLAADLHAKPVAALTTFKPDYVRDVFPILEHATQFRWVTAQASNAHFDAMSDPELANPAATAKPLRVHIQQRLRLPVDRTATPSGASQTMPRLLGDEPYDTSPPAPPGRRRLAITPTQYAILDQWARGSFIPPAGPPPVIGAAPTITLHDPSPWELDRAALEGCVGGAFYPGIEVGWQIRHAALFIAPFRIRHGAPSTYVSETNVTVGAGHFSRQMAVPWQADFMDCREEKPADGRFGWWPSQRPDDARKDPNQASMASWTRGSPPDQEAGHVWMVQNWAKLGFVLRQAGDTFIEVERDPSLPP